MAAFRDTVDAVCGFRQWFNEYFSRYIDTPCPPQLEQFLGPSQFKETLEVGQIDRMKLQAFSDTIIVFFPLGNSFKKVQWGAIHAVLCACALLIPEFLAKGIPIRGAVELGLGVEISDGDLYGAVLSETVRLEKNAGYPRILAGKALVDFVRNNAPAPQYWFEKDDTCDDRFIVDYAGKFSRQPGNAFLKGALTKAQQYAHTELARHKQELGRFAPDELDRSKKKEKLVDYYQKLTRYLDSRLCK